MFLISAVGMGLRRVRGDEEVKLHDLLLTSAPSTHQLDPGLGRGLNGNGTLTFRAPAHRRAPGCANTNARKYKPPASSLQPTALGVLAQSRLTWRAWLTRHLSSPARRTGRPRCALYTQPPRQVARGVPGSAADPPSSPLRGRAAGTAQGAEQGWRNARHYRSRSTERGRTSSGMRNTEDTNRDPR